MANSGRLTECYEYCIKYYGDNLTELQNCYSWCSALWRPKARGVDLSQFRNCFPSGLLELGEFEARYGRVGRSGLDDWQIVAHISGAISKMLEEGRRNKCPDLDEAIIRVVTSKLDEMGIDRYSIRRAYLHGMSDEVRRLVEKVFPNVTEIERPTTSIALEETPRRSPSPPPPPPPIPPSPTPHRKYSFKGGGRGVRDVVALVIGVLGFLTWLYALYISSLLLMGFAALLALITLILKPRSYTGLWFTAVLLTALMTAIPSMPQALTLFLTWITILMIIASAVKLAGASRRYGLYRGVRTTGIVIGVIASIIFIYLIASHAAIPSHGSVSNSVNTANVVLPSLAMTVSANIIGTYTYGSAYIIVGGSPVTINSISVTIYCQGYTVYLSSSPQITIEPGQSASVSLSGYYTGIPSPNEPCTMSTASITTNYGVFTCESNENPTTLTCTLQS